MSQWYQINPKVVLCITARSAQLPCPAGLSLLSLKKNKTFFKPLLK